VNPTEEPLTWSPSRGMGLLSLIVMVGTAILLLWIGTVLDSDAVDAMDGFEKLLFSIVPIGPFTWVMSVVLTALGLESAHSAFRGGTTLRLDAEGLHFRDGLKVSWDDVEVVDPERAASLRLASPAFRKPTSDGRPGKESRSPRPAIRELSSFDLGEDPRVVAKEIQRRRSDRGARSE